MLAEPLVVDWREPTMAATEVVLDHVLHGEGVLVLASMLLLEGLLGVQHLLRDDCGLERQLIGHLLQEALDLHEFAPAGNLDDDTARLNGRYIMIDGTLAAAHALALTLLRDGLPGSGHPPGGEHGVGVHLPADG